MNPQPDLERHYTPEQIAKAWCVHPATVRRLFREEPGVISLSVKHRTGARQRRTIRIPETVLQRVRERNQRA